MDTELQPGDVEKVRDYIDSWCEEAKEGAENHAKDGRPGMTKVVLAIIGAVEACRDFDEPGFDPKNTVFLGLAITHANNLFGLGLGPVVAAMLAKLHRQATIDYSGENN